MISMRSPCWPDPVFKLLLRRLPPCALLLGLFAGNALAAAGVDAGGTDSPTAVADCYRLAGEQYAPPAFQGVATDAIDADAAIAACEAARLLAPEDSMLPDLLGRAYQAHGDFANARRFFEAADRAGNAYAKANLGWFAIEGAGGAKDPARGLALLRQAAESGNILAEYSLGLIWREGRAGERPDPQQAKAWLAKAAGQGHAIAMYDLAILLRDTEGKGQELAGSFGWLKKAAALDDADSMAALGYAYEQGLGTQVDFTAAADWYGRAADHHQIDAMTNLGRLYEAGEGVPVDYDRAFALYRDAADGGNPTAMANLANLYEFGMGTGASAKEAAYWLARAIMAGNGDVLEHLTTTPDDYGLPVRAALQSFLQARGLYSGTVNGLMNPETVEGLVKLTGQTP